MRGRTRKGPNPLSRTYESNGPDVKIRGTALHVAEKYQQLARDAQASGDRIMSENYFQHAEHYLRIVAAAQPQGQPAAHTGRGEGDETEQEGAAQPQGQNERRQRPDRAERSERPERPERGDRPERHQRAAKTEQPGEYVEEDSPQPFIENMPVIDEAGQLNDGAAKSVEAASEGDDDDAKPRRRVRGTRGRGVKRTSGDAETEASPEPSEEAPAASAAEVEDAPKPKPRRAPRTRRPKATEEASEAEAVPAGE